MLSRAIESTLNAIRLGSASSFLGVVAVFLFLLLIPRDRLKAYLSKAAVRRFVEYFGNVGLGDDEDHRSRTKIAGRA